MTKKPAPQRVAQIKLTTSRESNNWVETPNADMRTAQLEDPEIEDSDRKNTKTQRQNLPGPKSQWKMQNLTDIGVYRIKLQS